MKQQTNYLDTLFIEKEEKLKWYQKIGRFAFWGIAGIICIWYVTKVVGKAKSSENATLRKKLKHFNPTIHEGIFYNTITWTGREKPLTDEEVEQLM